MSDSQRLSVTLTAFTSAILEDLGSVIGREIDPDSDLVESEGLDSLQLVALLVATECQAAKVGELRPPPVVEGFTTLRDFYFYYLALIETVGSSGAELL